MTRNQFADSFWEFYAEAKDAIGGVADIALRQWDRAELLASELVDARSTIDTLTRELREARDQRDQALRNARNLGDKP